MKQRHIEAINKLIESKQLEKEALLSLVPDKTSKHMEVIMNECKEMIMEILLDSQETEKKESTEDESRISKVTIE